MQALITFDSTHNALQAEQLLNEAALLLDTIPTPREISASCGLALSVLEADLHQAVERLQLANVKYRAIYLVCLHAGAKSYRRWEEN